MFQYLPPTGSALVACDVNTPPAKVAGCLRLVCLSDTHLQEEKFAVPAGDVLIHSGDILLQSSEHSAEHADQHFRKFCKWLEAQPHEKVIVVCGNHDAKLLDFGKHYMQETLPKKATYLENETTTISGLTFFGSPHSVGGSTNYAWQRRSAKGLWDDIPSEVDVVISHGPAYVKGHCKFSKEPEWIAALQDSKASYHICGHLHWAYGLLHLPANDPSTLISCVCASSMDGSYQPTNQAVVIDVPVNRSERIHPLSPIGKKVLLFCVNRNKDYDTIIYVLRKTLQTLFTVYIAKGPEDAASVVSKVHSEGRTVAAFIGFGEDSIGVLECFKGYGTPPHITVMSRYCCGSGEKRKRAHSRGVHLVAYKDSAENDIAGFCCLAYDVGRTAAPAQLSIRSSNVSFMHPVIKACRHPVLAPGVSI
eukprot:TRINITY_DN4625_c0_g2_i1.p1 TRINITY_DN4625_c0_g2~~TRINITY_DN4625_c0_g2_i1.p1  ORF type:complete len:420 (+),score=77.37 TRINITY_DN4625_c0_g2_i1:52-1311(+)